MSAYLVLVDVLLFVFIIIIAIQFNYTAILIEIII